MPTFKRYTYHQPDSLPVVWDDGAALQGLDDADIQAAGFDPDDEELNSGRLVQEWNNHPAGAIVLSGLTVEGHPFAVAE